MYAWVLGCLPLVKTGSNRAVRFRKNPYLQVKARSASDSSGNLYCLARLRQTGRPLPSGGGRQRPHRPHTHPRHWGWGNLRKITHKGVKLAKGTQRIRVVMDENGLSKYVGDFDYFEFTPLKHNHLHE